ncbi:Protein ssh4 [Malassezia psittaci]|uniref:Protein ssh4 n=1 Tax=Malassezia psittaci TaxID=1821823 RepID=A0AAF0F534_9BASI|nr:Protein ssh4 [Malassezia psittaci]
MGVPTMEEGDESELFMLLLPLLILLCAVLFMAVTPFVFCILFRLREGISLSDNEGPINIAHEEQRESRSSNIAAQQRWADQIDRPTRNGHERAVQWCIQHPPTSPRDTDITMAQFLGIQEKGVSAWSFDPAYESNVGAMVSARTEVQFFDDSPGMAAEEGGACTMQTNLPIPKMNDVYYWEVKMFTKPESTTVAVGLASKPYPPFRFPGYCKHSVGYMSDDGSKCFNHPFHAQSYGPAYVQGDVIGIGYRPRTGSVFFSRNGRRLEEAFIGLSHNNVFPTLAANGAAELHVNLGQAGFVLIEANVKRWGLAPMTGTLAPPPAYGHDKDSILIETGFEHAADAQSTAGSSRLGTAVPDQSNTSRPDTHAPAYASSADWHPPTGNGIRLDTLARYNDSPPPYLSEPHTQSSVSPVSQERRVSLSAEAAPSDPELRSGGSHTHPSQMPSRWSSWHNWVPRWIIPHDNGRSPTNFTELTGVTIE